MSRLALFSRVAFAWPIERLHPGRRGARADGSPASSANGAAGDEQACTEAERLERISVYARAGYFHMGYTFDMYPLVGDLPPE